ncbi:MAG: hypothetical protein FWC60_07930 [Firmicutes bacterium]|nr:hypothetical protein [Bacillota bacterium]
MQWQGIKIPVVALALVIALAAFFGSHWLYKSLSFEEPLKKELDANKLVTGYTIEDSGAGQYQVSVAMKKTGNLMLAYRQIDDAVKEVMGGKQYRIKLADQRDEQLTEQYYQGHFAVYEALVRGNFREMAGELSKLAERAGVESKVYVDENNIYWQMSHGQHYLYEVIPRPLSGAGPGNAGSGGR